MKKLLTVACSVAALTASQFALAGPDSDYSEAPAMTDTTVHSGSSSSGISWAGLDSINYDYVEVGWAFSSFDIDELDDTHGGYIDLSVSIADNAYIKLFGNVQDDAAGAGAAIGLHHELVENLDLITDVGGFYQDVTDGMGVFAELGGRWLACKYVEIDASAGFQYVDDENDFYGIVRAIVPLYKSLSFVASTKLNDDAQTYRAGFRLDF